VDNKKILIQYLMIIRFIHFLFSLGLDRFFIALRIELDRRQAERQVPKAQGGPLRFFGQGEGSVAICGTDFAIHPTSHLKSGTYINASGGVRIGQHFHTGRGLTIYSTNHDYDGGEAIPYGEKEIPGPVHIEDFVWCGANFTILPGVTVGEGAVIGAGAVVTKSIPPMAIACGNPAKVVKYRNKDHFQALKTGGKWI